MATDINSAITDVQTAVNKLGTDLTAEIAAFKAALAQGVDTTPQVTALENIAAQLTTLDANVVAATPAAPASTTSEATSPTPETTPASA